VEWHVIFTFHVLPVSEDIRLACACVLREFQAHALLNPSIYERRALSSYQSLQLRVTRINLGEAKPWYQKSKNPRNVLASIDFYIHCYIWYLSTILYSHNELWQLYCYPACLSKAAEQTIYPKYHDVESITFCVIWLGPQ